MGLTNKLCNPTPFKQKFHYGAGTETNIEPLSTIELHYTQMGDFVPSKPGWPAIKETLEYQGLFVYDPDRPYDNQALEAITKSRDLKIERYRAGKEEMKNAIARQGLQFSEDALNERLARAGYARLQAEIKELDAQIEYYTKIVKTEELNVAKKYSLDPKRTVFILNPPREFPSEGAMHYFLNRPENQALKEKHEAWLETMVKASKPEKKTNV